MTMDKSLKVRKDATSVRGVLTRAERIAKLTEQEAFPAGRSPIGLPKVRVQKVAMKKKKKTKEDAEAAKAGEKPAAAAAAKKK